MNVKRAAHLIDAHWSVWGDRRSKVPSIHECDRCGGEASWNKNPRHPHGPNYHTVNCPECDGKGRFYSPDCKAVRRYVLHNRNAA